MTKQEFQDSIRALVQSEQGNDTEINGVIVLLLKDGTTWLLNLNSTDQRDIIEEYVSALRTKCLNEDFDLRDYSSADERTGCFYDYDIDEIPNSFHVMAMTEREQENLMNFDVSSHRLAEVAGIVVFLSTADRKIALFKNVYSVEIIGVQSKILVWKLNDRFERATNDLIRLTPNFDVVFVDDHYIITNIKSVERLDQLTQITLNEASAKLNRLNDLNIIQNIQRVQDIVSGDVSLARKMIATVSSSKVVDKNISTGSIIEFAKNKESKIGALSYSDDDSQIIINSKNELRILLNILNDDLLKSELTDEDYLSKSKNILIE